MKRTATALAEQPTGVATAVIAVRRGKHLLLTVLVASAGVALIGCASITPAPADQGSFTPQPGANTPTPPILTNAPGATDVPTTPAPENPTEAPGPGDTPTSAPTELPSLAPTDAPSTAGLQLDLLAHSENVECSLIPNGALDGSDQLTVFFYFSLLYATPDQLDQLVAVTGTSDGGLSTSYSSAVNNQAFSAANFSLRPTDYGTTQVITLTVDSDGHYAETDETNNVATVTVTLPTPRPAETVDPLACG